MDYLAWLAEDEPARKEQRFAEMSTGWVIGTAGFARETMQAQVDARGQGRRMTNATRVAQEAVWQETLEKLLRTLSRTADELKAAGKSAGWKLALAAALKARTTATNRWLGTALKLGNLHEVSRKVAAWTRAPDAALSRKLALTPNPKPQSLTPFSQSLTPFSDFSDLNGVAALR